MRIRDTALRNSRAAVAIAGIALAVTICGVTPADAVRAVKRALNADAVDGFSASKTPRPGRLLALGADGKFPRAVLPEAARGPRGPEGPAGVAGPSGPTGPSGAAEAYIDRNNSSINLITNSYATIAELRVPAGSYALDFAAHTYLNAAVSTFVDCQMTANGEQIVKTAASVGTEETIEGMLTMTEAATFAETTALRVLCSEREVTDGRLTDARLRAIRVTTVIEQ